MILDTLKINTIQKLKIFLWILAILLALSVLFTIWQYLSIPNIFYVSGVISSIILPFIIGYYYNVYHDQKNAINELYDIIKNLWADAKEIEAKANDKNYFIENEVFNCQVFYEAQCLQKEVSLLYILGFYFDTVRWYNHQLYNLPINFKDKISWLCKINLMIDNEILNYDCISLEEFIRHQLLPIQYGYCITVPVLKNFFDFLILNSDNKTEYNEILTYLEEIFKDLDENCKKIFEMKTT